MGRYMRFSVWASCFLLVKFLSRSALRIGSAVPCHGHGAIVRELRFAVSVQDFPVCREPSRERKKSWGPENAPTNLDNHKVVSSYVHVLAGALCTSDVQRRLLVMCVTRSVTIIRRAFTCQLEVFNLHSVSATHPVSVSLFCLALHYHARPYTVSAEARPLVCF